MLKLASYQMLNFIKYPISIAKNPPFWFKGPAIIELSPSTDLMSLWKNSIISFDEYKFRYSYDILRNLDPWIILNKIKRYCLNDLDNCALISYENSKTISYRDFVGEWLHLATGINVKEATSSIAKNNTIEYIDSKSYIDQFKRYKYMTLNAYENREVQNVEDQKDNYEESEYYIQKFESRVFKY